MPAGINPEHEFTPLGGQIVWRGDPLRKRVYDTAAGKFPAFLRLHV
jgi:hypothetical protein